MVEFFVLLVGGFGVAVMGVSVVALIRPLPGLKLPTRGRAALILVVSFIVTGATGSLLPSDKVATVQPPSATPPERPNDAPPPTLAAEVQSLTRLIEVDTGDCEEAGRHIAKTARSGESAQAVYDAAEHAKQLCKATVTIMDNLKPPASIDGKARDAFRTALNACRRGYEEKAADFSILAEAIDSGRLSDASEAKAAMQEAATRREECLARVNAAAEGAGVTLLR
jgi:hypothetical protein